MSGIIGSKLNHRGSGTVAKLGTDGQHLLSSGAGKSATYETVVDATYDDNKLQANIAMLGFKIATADSLAKYDLVDQIVDEYESSAGVDAGASTNEGLISGAYIGLAATASTATEDADSTGTDGIYKWYKWTDTAATGSYSVADTESHEWLVTAGGGAGGSGNSGSSIGGGGGGAGGYRTGTALSLTGGNTYTITVGAGGTAVAVSATSAGGSGGNSIISGTSITTITSAGGGGGATRSAPSEAGVGGGSGGGASYGQSGGAATSITQYTGAGETTTIQGRAGGGPVTHAASGGGHGAAGTGSNGSADAGGVGTANDIIATDTDVYYAGGGGAGASGQTASGGAGGNGGGGAGGGGGANNAVAGTANTGGGGGGGCSGQSPGTGGQGKNGGSGIVILRRVFQGAGGNLTLQSTDTTASTADPDYADMIVLMENAEGTATLNTDIKGYISEDSGSTFTQGTLVEEGTWGTDKKIIAFHDLDISAQSGSAMCYKITTHNQSAGSKETSIHATSIGWR